MSATMLGGDSITPINDPNEIGFFSSEIKSAGKSGFDADPVDYKAANNGNVNFQVKDANAGNDDEDSGDSSNNDSGNGGLGRDYYFNDDNYEGKFDHYKDVIDYLETRRDTIKLPSKEDLEKERRRQRTESIIGGIADGVSAFSNLIATTQGAPNMYDPTQNLTDRVRERYDKMKADRDAEEEKYLNYAMTIGKLKDAAEKDKYQRGRDKLSDNLKVMQEKRAQEKEEKEAALADLRAQLLEGKIDEQTYKTKTAEIESGKKVQLLDSQIEKNKSQTRKNDRTPVRGSDGGSKKGSGKKGRGGSSGSKDKTEITVKEDPYGRKSTTTKTTTFGSGGGSKGKRKINGYDY